MATPDNTMFNLTSYNQANWERNAYLSMAALITYEYFIQIGNEVELFWKKRWSFGKIIFLWSRYYSVAFNISNAVIFLHFPYGDDGLNLCAAFFHWQNTGAALQSITNHVILELRLYAMYGRSKAILVVLVFLTLAEVGTMGYVFGYQIPGGVGTNNPDEGVFICADGDPPGVHFVAYYWTSILCIEAILLALAMYQWWVHRTRPGHTGGHLMRKLTRESLIYFLCLLLVYLTNQILWIKNILTLNEFGTAFALVLSNVFANRLMISVRQVYFQAEDDDVGATLQFSTILSERSSMRESRPGISRNSTLRNRTFADEDNEIELQMYNATAGF